MYEQKYLKYKAKYLELKAELDGGLSFPSFGKRAPDGPEVIALKAKRTNVVQKIATLKEQINAQSSKDAAEAKLAAATSSVDSANKKAADEKAARKAKKDATGSTGTAVAMGGVWNPFAKSGPKSAALLALEEKLSDEQKKLKLIDEQITAQQKVDQAKFEVEEANKKQDAATLKAAQQKVARGDSKRNLNVEPTTPTTDPSAAPAAYW